jgi:anti-sigma factor RsiW
MNLEILNAYLDGELAPHERAAVERAMASDPVLADAYARLAALDGLVEDAFQTACGARDGSGAAAAADDADDADAAAAREWARGIIASERRVRRGRLIAFATAAAGIAAALLLVFLPSVQQQPGDEDLFTVDEEASYVYWETDAETFGTGNLAELEDEILDVLGAT